MMCFLILALLAAAGADPLPGNRVARSSGCDSVYSDITSSHTMCLQDVGQVIPLSSSDITNIVDKHNTYRNNVSPPATNLFKLEWDADIATVALKLAKQCTMNHDPFLARRVPTLPGVHIGQNIGGGYSSILAAIDDWYSEVDYFEYGFGNTSLKAVGHYTQVVGYRAIRVGCGQAACPGSEYPKYQVCNYAVGQYTPDLKKPYKMGTSCSDCPSGKCEENLCYCGGKVCLNGGSLDPKTCTCTCKTTYSGDTCQTESSFDCPVSDPAYCNTDELPLLYCGGDWMMDNCPIKCGRCSAPANCNKQCTNAGVLLPGCTCQCFADFSGDTCETLTCPSTPSYSGLCSLVTSSDTSACDHYWNVKYSCPSLCGLCTSSGR